ncbi:ABC transporter ATP-binding protein [uncultured Pseudoramibacter sp.]|uniref:ABC transporter ATP-binding protein n=1 Tax=uncultured Pseudoramibacter sp. TaxID=1623493 RepID=UPI0025D9AE16|nr:ABC transporter ATP-binding protein [uncultured Pseudoramibacter sp.]
MKKLFAYLKDYRRDAILAPTFKLLEAFFDLLVPLVVAKIIDVGIAQDNHTYIVHMVIVMLILAVAGLASSITAQFFAARSSVGCVTDMRQGLFDHIQKFSYSELDQVGTDTLITRMTSDMQQVQNGLNMALRLLLRSPIVVLGSMIMAFTIDVKCALVFVVAIPILSLVVFGIMRVSIPMFRRVQKKLDRLLGSTRENLTGVRVVRAFGQEKDAVKAFDDNNDALTRWNEKVGRWSAALNPLTYAIVNIATIVLIQVGAIRVNMGGIQQGQVVALYNYMAQMIIELIKLAQLIVLINRSIACAERIQSVFEIKPGMAFPKDWADGTDANDTAVVFDHVTFTYENGGAPALSDISFKAKKGETVGIIGGTGSGKSTLVSLIPRFYDAGDGAVTVFGEDVRDYPKGKLNEKIGFVPQRVTLFEGSIRDNLSWGKADADSDEMNRALATAQVKDVVDQKPEGLDFHLQQNGHNLSGGQRQRLTIARALVRKPEILIMDDSASALDFATDAALRQAIHSLHRDMTVFIVSQRTASVMSADQILVLDQGQLVGQGTHEELLAHNQVYQEIYYSQFPKEDGADNATAQEA